MQIIFDLFSQWEYYPAVERAIVIIGVNAFQQ
jgi:hypothetical protein